MADRVELPPGCMITDRRTWEQHQRRLGHLEHENRQRAERIQNLVAANEALRRRVAEAEAMAIEALTTSETATARSDRGDDAIGTAKRALALAEKALARVAESSGRESFGAAPSTALEAVRGALRKLAGVGRPLR